MRLKAQIKDTYREILRSRERFISILLITFLSVGFFVGVKATAPSMRTTAENYFNAASLMDLEIISTVGFDDGDAEAVRALEGVAEVMPSYSADLIVLEDAGNSVARVAALPDGGGEGTLNRIKLVSGRMPEKPGECVAAAYNMRGADVAVGDVIRFSETAGSAATDTIISGTSYTVVGLIETPQYFSYSYGTSSIGNGTILYYIMLPACEFMYTRYTELYIALDRAPGASAFDPRYGADISRTAARIGDVGLVRYDLFLNGIQARLNDAQDEFNEQKTSADRQLADAKLRLEESARELAQAREEIAAGWEEYDRSVLETEAGLKKAEADLAAAKAELAGGEAQLAAAQAQYDAGTAQLMEARAGLDSGWRQYYAGEAEYQRKEREYGEGLAQYREAREEYDQAKNAYDVASEAVALAEQALDGGEIDQAEAESLYEQALAALEAYENSGGADPEMLDQLRAQVQAAAERMLNAEDREAQAREELENAKAQLAVYDAQLKEAEAELNAAEQQLAQARIQLDEAAAQLGDAREELEGGEEEYAANRAQLDDARAQLQANRTKLDAAKSDLAAGEREYAQQKLSAPARLAEAKTELEAAEEQLAAGQDEYDAGYADYLGAAAEAQSSISDGRSRIQNIRDMFSSVESGKWYAFSRDDIILSYAGLDQDAQRIDAIAAIFPVFFVLVASLVCLTTMSRMIDEQRVQIGTYKALGYSSAQISGKYMVYSAAACMTGGVLGQLICIQLLPRVIIGAYSTLYRLPDIEIVIPWSMSALSMLAALLCTVMAAWYSCHRELKVTTAALMRPKMPRGGKRIFMERWTKLWRAMSFSQKITARNLLRYKLRLLMTVLGISGCMALIVAGLGMHDGVNPIVDKQYGEINRYKIMFTLSRDLTRGEADALGRRLAADGRLSGEMFSKIRSVDVDGNGEDIHNVFVFTPQDAARIDRMISLRSPEDGSPLRLGDEGVIITDKLAQVLGAGAGDMVAFSADGERYTLPVAAIAENYIYHYIYMSPALYEETFGAQVKFNTIACAAGEGMTDFDGFAADWLSKDSSILSISNVDSARKSFDETIRSINIIIFVMLIAAGALAFVVVYNLTNINISERTREIATIKVLGFRHGETNMYIFRENFVMGALGILLGSVIGCFLARFMLKTVEVDMVRFVRSIAASSYVYAALLTAFYIVSVNLLMTRRMRGISMVESLKAIE
ncbi:MAG: Chromosome partition protein Smc [Firmicutes bacterium ADurb.Bin248]|nr:MAG: Chromosome partition protein Smc [Firmicutes bacterium ADurb.Bin248]HOF99656.1 FtsX-like permease family protein [Clostridia bacterium]